MTWAPGQSGNPTGRPRGAAGLARYIAEQTANGRELVDRLLEIARSSEASTREVVAAVMALLDRLAGKPLAQHEVLALGRIEHAPAALPADWGSLSLADRRTFLDQLEARAHAGTRAVAALALAAPPADGAE